MAVNLSELHDTPMWKTGEHLDRPIPDISAAVVEAVNKFSAMEDEFRAGWLWKFLTKTELFPHK